MSQEAKIKALEHIAQDLRAISKEPRIDLSALDAAVYELQTTISYLVQGESGRLQGLATEVLDAYGDVRDRYTA